MIVCAHSPTDLSPLCVQPLPDGCHAVTETLQVLTEVIDRLTSLPLQELGRKDGGQTEEEGGREGEYE